MLGPHLLVDLYGCEEEKIADKEFIERVLNELPSLLKMNKISEPMIVEYKGKVGSFDKGGITGIVFIAESHVSIHTWRGYNFASIDVFSCKEFDAEEVERYLIEKFKPKRIERHLIVRGKDFEKEI